MTRRALDYTAPAATPSGPTGYRADEPTAGYYRVRLRTGAAPCGVRIWFGPPLDPVTGEEMDRSHRWQAEANGEAIDLDLVWPRCGREPIGEGDYHALCRQQDWARDHAPDSALADPRRRHDPLASSVRYF